MVRYAIAILGAVLGAGAAALGQPAEMTLNEKGEWVAAAPAVRSADAMVMDEARRLLAEEKPGRARSLLNTWIEEHEFLESAHLAEAYLLRADAKTAGGNEYKALYDYEVVTKEFAATEEFVKAVERELEIGVRYLGGLRRKLLGMRIVRAESIGEELVLRTAERMYGSRLGERAVIELADYYYRTRDLESAAMAYEKFVQAYPRSQHATRARQQRIFASIGQFKGPNYDAAGLADAKVLIEEYAKDDPIGAQRANLSDALVARLDESIAAQMLEKAKFYVRRGDPVSARATLRRLIKDHPRSVAASQGQEIMDERKWMMPERAAAPSAGGAVGGTAGGGAGRDAAKP
jgi:tetratricopeptide (TPR) repeat protein